MVTMIVVIIGILPEFSITTVVIMMVEDTSVVSTGELIAVVIMFSVILGKVLFTESGHNDVIMTVSVGFNGTDIVVPLIVSVSNVNTSTGVIIELISWLVTSIVDIIAVGIKAVLVVPLAMALSMSTVAVIGLMGDEILSDIVAFIMSTGDVLMMVLLSFCAAVSE